MRLTTIAQLDALPKVEKSVAGTQVPVRGLGAGKAQQSTKGKTSIGDGKGEQRRTQ